MLEFFQTLSWAAVFQIIMIDILLGGDNAVVIALACRNLPEKQRLKGVLWGTAGAIVLRVILIAFALTLLAIPYLKIIGALLLAWVAIRLLVPEEEGHGNIQSSPPDLKGYCTKYLGFIGSKQPENIRVWRGFIKITV